MSDVLTGETLIQPQDRISPAFSIWILTKPGQAGV